MEPVNNGFWDLEPEDRGAVYEQAERDTGVSSFWDLSAEERGYYYDKAERDGLRQ